MPRLTNPARAAYDDIEISFRRSNNEELNDDPGLWDYVLRPTYNTIVAIKPVNKAPGRIVTITAPDGMRFILPSSYPSGILQMQSVSGGKVVRMAISSSVGGSVSVVTTLMTQSTAGASPEATAKTIGSIITAAGQAGLERPQMITKAQITDAAGSVTFSEDTAFELPVYNTAPLYAAGGELRWQYGGSSETLRYLPMALLEPEGAHARTSFLTAMMKPGAFDRPVEPIWDLTTRVYLPDGVSAANESSDANGRYIEWVVPRLNTSSPIARTEYNSVAYNALGISVDEAPVSEKIYQTALSTVVTYKRYDEQGNIETVIADGLKTIRIKTDRLASVDEYEWKTAYAKPGGGQWRFPQSAVFDTMATNYDSGIMLVSNSKDIRGDPNCLEINEIHAGGSIVFDFDPTANYYITGVKCSADVPGGSVRGLTGKSVIPSDAVWKYKTAGGDSVQSASLPTAERQRSAAGERVVSAELNFPTGLEMYPNEKLIFSFDMVTSSDPNGEVIQTYLHASLQDASASDKHEFNFPMELFPTRDTLRISVAPFTTNEGRFLNGRNRRIAGRTDINEFWGGAYSGGGWDDAWFAVGFAYVDDDGTVINNPGVFQTYHNVRIEFGDLSKPEQRKILECFGKIHDNGSFDYGDGKAEFVYTTNFVPTERRDGLNDSRFCNLDGLADGEYFTSLVFKADTLRLSGTFSQWDGAPLTPNEINGYSPLYVWRWEGSAFTVRQRAGQVFASDGTLKPSVTSFNGTEWTTDESVNFGTFDVFFYADEISGGRKSDTDDALALTAANVKGSDAPKQDWVQDQEYNVPQGGTVDVDIMYGVNPVRGTIIRNAQLIFKLNPKYNFYGLGSAHPYRTAEYDGALYIIIDELTSASGNGGEPIEDTLASSYDQGGGGGIGVPNYFFASYLQMKIQALPSANPGTYQMFDAVWRDITGTLDPANGLIAPHTYVAEDPEGIDDSNDTLALKNALGFSEDRVWQVIPTPEDHVNPSARGGVEYQPGLGMQLELPYALKKFTPAQTDQLTAYVSIGATSIATDYMALLHLPSGAGDTGEYLEYDENGPSTGDIEEMEVDFGLSLRGPLRWAAGTPDEIDGGDAVTVLYKIPGDGGGVTVGDDLEEDWLTEDQVSGNWEDVTDIYIYAPELLTGYSSITAGAYLDVKVIEGSWRGVSGLSIGEKSAMFAEYTWGDLNDVFQVSNRCMFEVSGFTLSSSGGHSGGFAFWDKDSSATYNPGELYNGAESYDSPIGNLNVRLYAGDAETLAQYNESTATAWADRAGSFRLSEPITQTRTNALGEWRLADLYPGEYYVHYELPTPGYYQPENYYTARGTGPNASHVDAVSGKSDIFTVSRETDVSTDGVENFNVAPGINAGVKRLGGVSVYIYAYPLNADGKIDPGYFNWSMSRISTYIQIPNVELGTLVYVDALDYEAQLYAEGASLPLRAITADNLEPGMLNSYGHFVNNTTAVRRPTWDTPGSWTELYVCYETPAPGTEQPAPPVTNVYYGMKGGEMKISYSSGGYYDEYDYNPPFTNETFNYGETGALLSKAPWMSWGSEYGTVTKREGFTFEGWTTVDYMSYAEITPESRVSFMAPYSEWSPYLNGGNELYLYAIWKPELPADKDWMALFCGNGATTTEGDEFYDEALSELLTAEGRLPESKFNAPEDMEFKGWWYNADVAEGTRLIPDRATAALWSGWVDMEIYSPDYALTLYAIWGEPDAIPSPNPTPTQNPTSGGAISREKADEGGYHRAYIIGYEDGMVRPQNSITRAEVCAIFYRVLDEDLVDANTSDYSGFTDVDKDAWYNRYVATCAKLGLVAGYEDNTFRPNNPITREELAQIIGRTDTGGIIAILNPPVIEANLSLRFSDVPNSGHWAATAIYNAVKVGYMRGQAEGKFGLGKNLTRAEFVTAVNRVLERGPELPSTTNTELPGDLLDGMVTWPDNKPGTWYYTAVQEASQSHEYIRKATQDAALSFKYEKWTKLRYEGIKG
jgi:hypothetical protein